MNWREILKRNWVGGDKMTKVTDLEKLKAQVEALNEMRKAFNERFLALSEKIGEVRTMIIDQERETKDLKIEAKKAADLIKAVKPENILKEVKLEDAKIEALKGKLESNEVLFNKIINDLKEMRETVARFKGVESLVKMESDIKSEIDTIREIERNVEVHSGKVEDMFINLQRKLKEFEYLDKKVEEIANGFNVLMENFERLNVELSGTVKMEDIKKLRGNVNRKLREMKALALSFSREKKKLEGIVNKSEKNLSRMEERIKRKIRVIKSFPKEEIISLVSQVGELQGELDELKDKIAILEPAKLPENMDDVVRNAKPIKELEKKMEKMDKLTSKIEKLDTFLDAIGSLRSDFERVKRTVNEKILELKTNLENLQTIPQQVKRIDNIEKEQADLRFSVEEIKRSMNNSVAIISDLERSIEKLKGLTEKYEKPEPPEKVSGEHLSNVEEKTDKLIEKLQEIKERIEKGEYESTPENLESLKERISNLKNRLKQRTI
jgi:chromosome segregation ATPase